MSAFTQRTQFVRRKDLRRHRTQVWHIHATLVVPLMLVALTARADLIHDAIKANDIDAVKQYMAYAEKHDGKPGLNELINRREGTGDKGMTPLQIAAANGRAAIIRLLAATNLVDVDAVSYTFLDGKGTAFNLAARNGHVGAIKALSETGTADPNGNYRNPPLVSAMRDNQEESIMALLEAGADVNVTFRVGRREVSVLQYAHARLDYFTNRYTGSNKRRLTSMYRNIVNAMERHR